MTESILATRCRTIREMLSSYAELTDTLNGPGGVRGDGGSIALTPHQPWCLLTTSKGDQRATGIRCSCGFQGVRELERLLRVMREDRTAPLVTIAHGHKRLKASVRSLWWHVNQRYIAAPTRIETTTVTAKRLDKHGLVRRGKDGQVLFETKQARMARKVVDPKVDERLVTAGVTWIATAWSLKAEPVLPSELLVAA